MMTTTFEMNAPCMFDLRSLLHAHGWIDLLPNFLHANGNGFERVEALPGGQVVLLRMSEESGGGLKKIIAHVQHTQRISQKDLDELRARVTRMLRLDEDFEEFYALCSRARAPWNQMPAGWGRLLRSPTVFEDLVKVICTTNMQWGGTKRMVSELVNNYGKPFAEQACLKCFPNPSEIAAIPFTQFQSSLRLGYRAAYVHELAVRMLENPQDFNFLNDHRMPAQELKKNLLGIKGIGNYAAASMLMLLGCYDAIPVDSVFRTFMRRKYCPDSQIDLQRIDALYAKWGKWKFLAYWYELLSEEKESSNND